MQALQFLSDPAQIRNESLYRLKGECAELRSDNNEKIVMETYEVGVVDGYSCVTASKTLEDFKITPGYFIESKIQEANGVEECQITLHGPENVAVRIERIILSDWLQNLTCNNCAIHNPQVPRDADWCSLTRKREMIYQVQGYLTTHVKSGKPYLIALVPVELAVYRVFAFWQEAPNH